MNYLKTQNKKLGKLTGKEIFMKSFAFIAPNPYSSWPAIDVVVYQDGRLIYVLPEQQPECPQRDFETLAEAKQRLQQCYPDIRIYSDYAQFEKAYRAEGYHYPGPYSLQTDLLCNACHSLLQLDAKSRNAGINAPDHQLVHTDYHCTNCGMQYSRGKEGWYGPEYWLWKMPEEPWEYDKYCPPPAHMPSRNPYGFREMILIPNLEEEHAH